MIKLYNIINEPLPKLNVLCEFDIDNEPEPNLNDNDMSIHILRNELNLDKLNAEHLVCVSMDEANAILGFLIVSIGSQSECYIHKRTIAEFVLLTGAEKFIMVHNHPNGVLEASDGDKAGIPYLKEIASLLEIEFDGGYIITNDGYVNIETGCVSDDRWELYI